MLTFQVDCAINNCMDIRMKMLELWMLGKILLYAWTPNQEPGQPTHIHIRCIALGYMQITIKESRSMMMDGTVPTYTTKLQNLWQFVSLLLLLGW